MLITIDFYLLSLSATPACQKFARIKTLRANPPGAESGPLKSPSDPFDCPVRDVLRRAKYAPMILWISKAIDDRDAVIQELPDPDARVLAVTQELCGVNSRYRLIW